MDIACSNFSERSTIFGGKDNLKAGLMNAINQYKPKMVGICTTCLAETIGDDVRMFIHQIKSEYKEDSLPYLVATSTPSYAGSHLEGFRRALAAVVSQVARPTAKADHINLISGMLSPEDLRTLKDILEAFGIKYVLLPDYSDRLDGQIWQEYQSNIDHGTSIDDIKAMADAKATVEFGFAKNTDNSSGIHLNKEYGIELFKMPLPIGLRLCDEFFTALKIISGNDIPVRYKGIRGRLIDAYVDGHKYLFGKRALIYGDEDMVVSMASFMDEIGIVPAICATGDNSNDFSENIKTQAPEQADKITVMNDTDFSEMLELAKSEGIDLIIGNSNGFKLARELDVPLIRVSLPIHDRIGAARVKHIGYSGTLELFDRIVNAIIERKQNLSPVGYTHI
jgi:nitrogenase molybdenum-iron protein NifN